MLGKDLSLFLKKFKKDYLKLGDNIHFDDLTEENPDTDRATVVLYLNRLKIAKLFVETIDNRIYVSIEPMLAAKKNFSYNILLQANNIIKNLAIFLDEASGISASYELFSDINDEVWYDPKTHLPQDTEYSKSYIHNELTKIVGAVRAVLKHKVCDVIIITRTTKSGGYELAANIEKIVDSVIPTDTFQNMFKGFLYRYDNIIVQFNNNIPYIDIVLESGASRNLMNDSKLHSDVDAFALKYKNDIYDQLNKYQTINITEGSPEATDLSNIALYCFKFMFDQILKYIGTKLSKYKTDMHSKYRHPQAHIDFGSLYKRFAINFDKSKLIKPSIIEQQYSSIAELISPDNRAKFEEMYNNFLDQHYESALEKTTEDNTIVEDIESADTEEAQAQESSEVDYEKAIEKTLKDLNSALFDFDAKYDPINNTFIDINTHEVITDEYTINMLRRDFSDELEVLGGEQIPSSKLSKQDEDAQHMIAPMLPDSFASVLYSNSFLPFRSKLEDIKNQMDMLLNNIDRFNTLIDTGRYINKLHVPTDVKEGLKNACNTVGDTYKSQLMMVANIIIELCEVFSHYDNFKSARSSLNAIVNQYKNYLKYFHARNPKVIRKYEEPKQFRGKLEEVNPSINMNVAILLQDLYKDELKDILSPSTNPNLVKINQYLEEIEAKIDAL